MNHFILFADGGLADTASAIGQKFGWTPAQFIAQCISFILVAILLRAFAYKPILQVLEERKKTIADGLKNAEQIKAELARTEAMQREVMDKANAQATKMIEEAREAAARVRDQETQKAISQAEQIISKAREATEMERARMLVELKRDVGQLVVRTTSAVTGKVLTADDQQRLVEETRRQLN